MTQRAARRVAACPWSGSRLSRMPAAWAGILFFIHAHIAEPLTMPGVGPVVRQQMRDTKAGLYPNWCIKWHN